MTEENYSKTTLKTTLFLRFLRFQNEIILNDKWVHFHTEKIIVSIRIFENHAKQSSLWHFFLKNRDFKNFLFITTNSNKIEE